MLQELSIRNFAIIKQLTVSFDQGMTVLTGETGAGKSIVIDAVSLLVGARGSSDYIRANEEKCQLEGLFTLPKDHPLYQQLEDKGIDCSDTMIIIQREITRHGRNTCRINGHLVNTTTLREVGRYLVDIQGQHDNQRLMHQEYHLSMLEQFATPKYKEIKARYVECFKQYKEKKATLDKIKDNEQAYNQRLDMLKYQVEEIEEAALVIGEEEALKEEREQLNNFQNIMEQLSFAYQALSHEETGTLVSLGMAMNALGHIASFSSEYQSLYEQLSEAYYTVQDSMDSVNHCQESLEMDEARLDEVEERLRLIRSLERKYGATIEEVLSYYDQITEELQETLINSEDLSELQEEVESLYENALTLSEKLTKERQQIAQRLEDHIHQELQQLYMEHARFSVHFLPFKSLQKDGAESVEFYIATNKGEELKPLSKVVSGGELSRVTLALKSLFMSEQEMTSIVFDEVDTGVSGRVASAIAKKISQLAKHSQVLCITHLPQVAAVADHHYFIEKSVTGERTQMKLYELSDKERINEIARMLSGDELTPLSLEHAEELLNHVQKERSL